MTNWGLAGIGAAYAMLVLLVAGVLLQTHWRWPVKALVALAGAGFLVATWISYPALLGWPVGRDLPARFRLHSAYVQQPDRNANSDGSIYLWVTDVADLGRHGTPRAYAIPYNAPTHEAVLTAMSRLNKGMAQLGTFSGHIVTGLHDPTRVTQAVSPVSFFDVPDPLFPDK